MEYLDLDLESESTNSQSPRHPSDSTNISNTASINHHPSFSINNNNNNGDLSQFLSSTEVHPSETASISSHSTNHYNNNNVNGCSNLNNESASVYKKVDFIKTKAFNDMRMHVDMYRNNDP